MPPSVLRRWLSALCPRPHTKRTPPSRTRLQLESLEGRLTPATLVVDMHPTAGQYAHIQDAINAAHSGDRIVVGPGTYTEQLTITKSNLTLTTADGKPDATVQAPANPTGSASIIDINGAKNVTFNDFNVNGNANTQTGIKVEGGGSATITNNNITNITGGLNTGVGGANLGGAGIVVGLKEAGTTGSAIVVGNTVSNYALAGIVIDNAGSNGVVYSNTVVGSGASSPNHQYGIQVSDGANACVTSNCVTANAVFDGADSAAILVFQAGCDTYVDCNDVSTSDFGLFVVGSSSVEISGNYSHGNNNDGIQLLGTSYSSVTGNLVLGNGGDGISIYGDPTGYGAAVNNVIAGNVIGNNAGNGVTVDLATGTQVVANIIYDNDGSGVAVQDGSSKTTIAFNFIDADDGTTAVSVSGSANTAQYCNLIVH